jgi:hypothetical protein
MKLIEPRPFTDPEAAARKLIELKGSPAEYKAGLDLALAKGWLEMHESGTYVRFTEAGAALSA